MDSTSPIENIIPPPNIIFVREASEQPTQEDMENRNKATGSSNQEDVQEKVEKQPRRIHRQQHIKTDIENRNQATESSNQSALQEQEENQSTTTQHTSRWNALYVVVILGTCVAWTCTVTIIPVHNILECPEFWWEDMFLVTGYLSLFCSTLPCAWAVYLIFNDDFFNAKLFLPLYFTAAYLGCNITGLGIYICWTVYMGYNFPMPWFKLPGGLSGFFTLCLAIWYGFPSELRTQPKFRTRLKSYIAYIAICLTIPYQEILLDTIYLFLNANEVPWFLAFIIPIFRGFYEWVLPKVFDRAAGRKNLAATFYMDTYIGCIYGLYVTVRLAYADESTENWMLGVEMSINFCYALQIIWMQNKVQGNMTTEDITKWRNKKQAILRNLVTMEAIEILIPLAYAMCYATAYYGPNATGMARIKITYFDLEVVDINDLMMSVFKMAGVDACGAILIGLLLRKLCEINICDEFCVILKQHWITLTLIMGSCVFYVSNIVSNTN